MTAPVTDYINPTDRPRQFYWNEQRSEAALALAEGRSKADAARMAGVDRCTIYDWLRYPDFCAEIDRLSLMVGVSSRAERLRLAMRIVRQRTDEEGNIKSEKDLLDWLKFAQSETDGAKIDLSKLAALLAGESGEGSATSSASSSSQPQQLVGGPDGPVIEVEAITTVTNTDDDNELNPS